MVRLAEMADERTLLLVLVSGGGSALLPLPAPGLTLAHKLETTRTLLSAGATIHEVNRVRKHLSAVKGGRLARAAAPAMVVGLLLSDVIGDAPETIASGPTAPDPSTFDHALGVLERHRLLGRVPPEVVGHLREGAAGGLAETPGPDDPLFARVNNLVIANSRACLEACVRRARELGFNSRVLTAGLEGEARDAGSRQARLLMRAARTGSHGPRPLCLVSGGETTVTLRGPGRGGRNQEFALAAARELAGSEGLALLSAGTDGTDGPTDAAGAMAFGDTLARAAGLGLDAAAHLKRNDSYPFFNGLGDLVVTGPTGTNVMDVQIMLAG